MGPSISKAIGMKVWVWPNNWYLNSFRSAAPSAAVPAVDDVTSRYDSARVLVTVTSQVIHWPACHGICINPFGRFIIIIIVPWALAILQSQLEVTHRNYINDAVV